VSVSSGWPRAVGGRSSGRRRRTARARFRWRPAPVGGERARAADQLPRAARPARPGAVRACPANCVRPPSHSVRASASSAPGALRAPSANSSGRAVCGVTPAARAAPVERFVGHGSSGRATSVVELQPRQIREAGRARRGRARQLVDHRGSGGQVGVGARESAPRRATGCVALGGQTRRARDRFPRHRRRCARRSSICAHPGGDVHRP
jgi:hypothetical protein